MSARRSGEVTRRAAVLGGLGTAAAACVAPMRRSGAPRRVQVGVAQMASANGDVAGNLRRATALVDAAADQGAQIVVFPEFMPTGYDLSYAAWDAAEPFDGPTVQWLRAQAERRSMHLGTSFLEADGDDFFNTFALATPTGEIAGAVRKQTPAGMEAYLFRGQAGPHVIETALGRIGVVICQENYRCFAAELMRAAAPDLILAPHSFPDLSASGGLASPPGTHVGGWFARRIGAPVAMANKTGAWTSPLVGMSVQAQGAFPGQSAIVAGGGAPILVMDGEEGCGVAEVTLAEAPPPSAPVCSGEIIPELTIRNGEDAGASLGASAALEAAAAAAYAANDERRRRARAISAR